ncbi:MAG: hypothetical protein FWC41_04760 [Firmicutes bacterium]|nr:hypothetical protein [Bacillota bacterium]
MKIKVNRKSNTVSISGMSIDSANAIFRIIECAATRCFQNEEVSDQWYSGTDFVCVLSTDEVMALRDFNTSMVNQLTKIND